MGIRGSTDAEIVYALERRSAIPADHGQTIAADEGIGYRPIAHRAIELPTLCLRLRHPHQLLN